MRRYVLAITGASGSLLGIRLLEHLIEKGEIHLLISSQTFWIIKEETGIDWSGKSEAETEKKIRRYLKSKNVYFYRDTRLDAPPASGSFITDGMLIVPCSMKTLSGVAHGYANNLIERSADVTIKEGRTLLLAPREMPFSAIHLENMLTLARLGVRIAPPVAAFYHEPKGLDDIVDFLVGKMLDAFPVEHNLFTRWGSKKR
ncbi:MAG TPA: flavin prenyltransferase UbiX [Thermodesulfovibrionales bacterium]|nr:flavin prenyltransferase UbiX [Thermodesulfovibrionales bacterium]